MDTDAFNPEKAATRVQRMQQIVRGVGEPIKGGFDPSTLAADLAPLGLSLQENLSPAEIEKRYFKGRTDDMHTFEHFYYAWVMVE